MTYRFCKGHGTENDFVVLPDHDGTVHGSLAAERVVALCDRRAGIGGDGVLRVVRASAVTEPPDRNGAEWFMDYRNADGSLSEMCGNGIRVFARHLVDEGLVTDAHLDASGAFGVATRDGVKRVWVTSTDVTVDMGVPEVGKDTEVQVGGRRLPAIQVSTGNPHAVAFVDDLAAIGSLAVPPGHDADLFPDGVNVEFVVRRGPQWVAMRVHERGSGETRSCGTGACAVAVAAAMADSHAAGGPVDSADPNDGSAARYRVDLPGGTLDISWQPTGRLLMTGPAVIVAEGVTDL